MWKEIKCIKCNGTGKIKEHSYNTTNKNPYIRVFNTTCYLCNGYGVIKQKCFGTEKNKIIKKRTKFTRFEIMDI